MVRGGHQIGLLLVALIFASACNNEIRELKSDAENGRLYAQNEMGTRHAQGLGLPLDYAEALKWYHRAAEKGYSVSQFNIAGMHEQGLGVETNLVIAAEWYLKAAERGHAESQFCLAVMYEQGKGVGKDIKEAVKWYQQSSEKNYPFAQNNLSMILLGGQGVPRDLIKAYKWSALASGQGEDSATRVLHKLTGKNEKGVVTEQPLMTPHQISEAEREIKEFVPRKKSDGITFQTAPKKEGTSDKK